MYRRTCGWVVAGLVLAAGLAVGGPWLLAADPQDKGVKLEGKTLHKVNPDDARLLSIIERGLANDAMKDGAPSAEQAALTAQILKAFGDKDFDTAYRLLCRGILMRRGFKSTEATELATSLDFQIDRKLAAPGETITLRIEPFFTLGQPLKGSYTVKLSLRSTAGDVLVQLPPLPVKEVADMKAELPIKDLKDGSYVVHYELVSGEGEGTVQAQCNRPLFVDAGAAPRIAALSKQLAQVAGTKVSEKSLQHRAAVESLTYLVALMERARTKYVASMAAVASPMVWKLSNWTPARLSNEPFNLAADIPLAEALASGLLSGKSPLAARTGDMRQAYFSPVDNTLQPYRVYLPSKYDPAKKYPLVVGLHGATGDENSYVDSYVIPGTKTSLFKKLAEERGYIVMAPNGRGPYGGYVDAAEKDVIDSLERVKQIYSINDKQVFLTGHSMGGIGTFLVGFKYPDKFAALAPVAGGPASIANIGMQKARDLPMLLVCGLKDNLATPPKMRALAEVAKKELKHFTYKEYDQDHIAVGVASMTDVFDFFDAQRKSLGAGATLRNVPNGDSSLATLVGSKH